MRSTWQINSGSKEVWIHWSLWFFAWKDAQNKNATSREASAMDNDFCTFSALRAMQTKHSVGCTEVTLSAGGRPSELKDTHLIYETSPWKIMFKIPSIKIHFNVTRWCSFQPPLTDAYQCPTLTKFYKCSRLIKFPQAYLVCRSIVNNVVNSVERYHFWTHCMRWSQIIQFGTTINIIMDREQMTAFSRFGRYFKLNYSDTLFLLQVINCIGYCQRAHQWPQAC